MYEAVGIDWAQVSFEEVVEPKPRRPKIADVMRVVCEAKGITLEEMRSDCRKRPLAYPRQVAMALAYELCGQSYPVIGRHFGRDHSTAVYAVRTVKAAAASNPKLADKLDVYRQRIAAIVAARPVIGAPQVEAVHVPRIPKRGKWWTMAETVRLRELSAAGKTRREIGEALGGRSISSVSKKLRRMRGNPTVFRALVTAEEFSAGFSS